MRKHLATAMLLVLVVAMIGMTFAKWIDNKDMSVKAPTDVIALELGEGR